MTTRTFTTLPNGLVRVQSKFSSGYEYVRHYGTVGRAVYVIMDYDNGQKSYKMPVVSGDCPYVMRDYETLEQAVRRMFAEPSKGLILTYVIIPMVVVAILAIIADPFNVLK